jgi:hypothetical protein
LAKYEVFFVVYQCQQVFLRRAKHRKIFYGVFFEMQPNTIKETIVLEIIYIQKHFTLENILQRNK